MVRWNWECFTVMCMSHQGVDLPRARSLIQSVLKKRKEKSWRSNPKGKVNRDLQKYISHNWSKLTHLCPWKIYWADFHNFLHINPSDEKFEFFALCWYIYVPAGINGLIQSEWIKMQFKVDNEPYLSEQECLTHYLTWSFLWVLSQ